MTPLLCAVAAGHTNCAKLLFEYGANIAARDKNQRGSIHLAVENEKAEMLKMLLERSGSQCINIPDIQERTALHYAASSTKLKVQAILKSDFRPYLFSLKWVWLDSGLEQKSSYPLFAASGDFVGKESELLTQGSCWHNFTTYCSKVWKGPPC